MAKESNNVVTEEQVEPQIFPKRVTDIVHIKRKLNKPVLPESGIMEESARDWSLCIGSAFAGPNSRVLLGRVIMTKPEEEKWMAKIVGISPNHQDWNKILDDYWANLYVKIPYEGRILDASYDQISETEIEPVNIEDFILYRYCLQYSQVANTLEEANSSSRIRFYLVRESEMKRAAEKVRAVKDRAIKLRMSIQDDLATVKAILVLGAKYVNRTESNPVFALADFSEQHPVQFLEIAGDKRLLDKAMIEKAIRAGIFTRPANSSIILYDGTQIAKNLDEAAIWLNLPENSETLLVIKDKMLIE